MTDERGSLATRTAPLAVGAVVVALLAVVAAGALPAGDTTPDGDEVLDRVEQRYDSAETLSGDATVTVANATKEHSTNVSFVVDRPNSTRLSVTHNGSEYVAGTNGTVAWVYDAANDTAIVRDLPENDSAWNRSAVPYNRSGATGNHSWAAENGTYAHPNASVEAYRDENVSAEVRGTETLEEGETYVVGLEPENESRRGNATLWVDTEDYRVHKVRTSYGENVTTVDFDGLQFNASVHESTFKPPDAATVNTVSQERYGSFEDAQANTDLGLQRLDAEGYEFAEAVVVTRNGWTVTTQEYTGEANVSVVATEDDVPHSLNATEGENVTVAGENATYVDRDDGSAVVWETDGVTRAVVGDLPRADLIDLAEVLR
jgi:outer membrane lipoprotein-sorting protein